MIEGYSVKDAAQVLGIPEGRIWELVARGVLAGTQGSDGSWRIHLGQTRPPEPVVLPTTAEPRQGTDDPRRQAAGNGGESSPFRELLTEFRNLTERYGQALLALGEARGEVAGLRSRVELLEARVDLRLLAPGAAPVGRPLEETWQLPDDDDRDSPAQPEETASVPDAVVPDSWAPAVEIDVTEDQRAASPSPPQERATEVEAEAVESIEVAEPESADREVEAAAVEPIQVEIAESPDEAEVGQAPGVALAPEPVPSPAPEAEAHPAAPQEQDPFDGVEMAAPERRSASGHSALAGLAEALERAIDPTRLDLIGSGEGQADSTAPSAPAAETAAEPSERSEVDDAADMEMAASGWRRSEALPRQEAQFEDMGDDPFPDQEHLGEDVVRELMASGLPDDVEPFDWDFGLSESDEIVEEQPPEHERAPADEVPLADEAGDRLELPGSDELREALRALGVEGAEAEASEQAAPRRPAEVPKPAERPQPARSEAERRPPTRSAPLPARPKPGPSEPPWLRHRRDPAATAFRRLRRLFPG